METWTTYRWRIFTFINCLYIAYEIGVIIYYQVIVHNRQGWVSIFDHPWEVIWPERVLMLSTVLSLALIMQYFQDSKWKIVSVYFYMTTVLTSGILGDHEFASIVPGILVLFSTLFLVIGLFNAKATGVSANFKWIGGAYLFSFFLAYLSIFWRILHWPFGPSQAIRDIFRLTPFIAILVLLLKMSATRLPSLDEEIGNIGVRPAEEDIYP